MCATTTAGSGCRWDKVHASVRQRGDWVVDVSTSSAGAAHACECNDENLAEAIDNGVEIIREGNKYNVYKKPKNI